MGSFVNQSLIEYMENQNTQYDNPKANYYLDQKQETTHLFWCFVMFQILKASLIEMILEHK
jgi:hypothetical protein